jgi:hypothetical protein
MRPRPDCPRLVSLSLALLLLSAAGCEGPRHAGGATSASPMAPSAADPAPVGGAPGTSSFV